MLNSITWEFFFTAVVVIVTVYYTVAACLFYHQEFFQWLKANRQKPAVTPVENTHTASLMGEAQRDAREVRTSVTSAEEISITTNEEDAETITPEITSPPNEVLIIGTLADLLQDIKTIAAVTADSKADQLATAELFQALLPRYTAISTSPYREAINVVIADTARGLSFEWPLTEINAWWEGKVNNNKLNNTIA